MWIALNLMEVFGAIALFAVLIYQLFNGSFKWQRRVLPAFLTLLCSLVFLVAIEFVKLALNTVAFNKHEESIMRKTQSLRR